MKGILFLFLSLIFNTHICYTQTVLRIDSKAGEDNVGLQEKVNSLESRVSVITDVQQAIQDDVARVLDVVSVSNSSINNSLNASTRFLTTVSIVMAVISVILAIYVDFMRRKFLRMKESVSMMEENVQGLVNDINRNVDKLFERIRREDTKALIQRLIEVPEDVANIAQLLLSRDLLKEDFKLLCTAYNHLIEREDAERIDSGYLSLKDHYLLLFFQHYLGLSIEENCLRKDIIGFFDTGLSAAFVNDLDYEIKCIGKSLSNKNANYNRLSVLTPFLVALRKNKRTMKGHYIQELKNHINDDSLWTEAEKQANDNLSKEKDLLNQRS